MAVKVSGKCSPRLRYSFCGNPGTYSQLAVADPNVIYPLVDVLLQGMRGSQPRSLDGVLLLPIPFLPGPVLPHCSRVSPRLTTASLWGPGAYIGHHPPPWLPPFLSFLLQQEIVKPKSVSLFFPFPPFSTFFPYSCELASPNNIKTKKTPYIPSHLLQILQVTG